MGIQKSEAILLSKREIRETSSIVHFYTKDFGKIKALIKGVRGSHAKRGSYLHEFAKFDIVFYDKRKSDIFMVTQCDLINSYSEIAEDLDKRLKAFYVVELVDKFTPLADKSVELYHLLEWVLFFLSTERFINRAIIIFQLKLLENSGLLPQFEECLNCSGKIVKDACFSLRLSGLLCAKCRDTDLQASPISRGAVSSINMIVRQKRERLNSLMVANSISTELNRLLERLIAYHLGEHLNTTDFMRQITV